MNTDCPQPVEELSTLHMQSNQQEYCPRSKLSIKIGKFRFFFDDNTVQSDNQRQSVQPKVMLLIKLLFEAKGNIVSRQEIEQTLWPRCVVGLDSVNNTVSRLRRVLNDQPKDPDYVETIARKGYRLIASHSTARKRSLFDRFDSNPFTNIRKLVVVSVLFASLSVMIFSNPLTFGQLNNSEQASLHRDPEMQKALLARNLTVNQLLEEYNIILDSKKD